MGTAATAVIGLVAAPAPRAMATPVGDPSPLGVASGDPAPDGFVLWTRRAPEPLAEDGKGSRTNLAFDVDREIATDERFRRNVRRGTEQTAPGSGGAPRTWRSQASNRTASTSPSRFGKHQPPRPDPHDADRRHPELRADPVLRLCAQREHGFSTAHRRMAEDHPDLVLHLATTSTSTATSAAPPTPGSPARSKAARRALAGYRRRRARTKVAPDLRLAHSTAPWLVVRRRRSAPPAARGSLPGVLREHAAAALVGAARTGRAALPAHPAGRAGHLPPVRHHLFDTRQHRSDQFCGGLLGPCGRESDPTRTLTGEDRQSWPGGARSSPARWEQVLMAQNDSAAGPLEMDDRDARAASRDRITRGWTNAGMRNPPCSPLTPTSTTPAISSSTTTIRTHRSPVPEPVTTPVTSGGVSAGEDSAGGPENPHSRFHDDMRGYVRTKISSGEPRADLRVPHGPERNSPAETEASSVISDRARVRKR